MRVLKRDTEALLTAKISRDLKVKSEIIAFGEDDGYPETIERLVLGSPTGAACLRAMSGYIAGDGFAVQGLDGIAVGTDGRGKAVTVRDLVIAAATDVAMFHGFYMAVLPTVDETTGVFGVASVRPLKYTQTRFSKPDSDGFSPFIYDRSAILKRDTPRKYGVFQPRTGAWLAQDKVGSVGQAYFEFMDKRFSYPLSLFDAVANDLVADRFLSTFRANQLGNGFVDMTFFGIPAGSAEEEDALAENIRKSMGVDGDRAMVYTMDRNPDGSVDTSTAIDVKNIKINFDPKMFDSWHAQIGGNIRRAALGIPQILIDFEAGASVGMVSGEAFKTAHDLYNQLTRDYRRKVGESVGEILSHSTNPVLRQNTDWSLVPKIL